MASFFKIFQRGKKEDKFVDQKFEELRIEWRSTYKQLKEIEKSLSAFTKPEHRINETSILKITEEVCDFLKGDVEVETYLEKAVDVVERVEVAANEYTNTQADIRQSLHEVIERYKIFKKKIKQRDELLQEYEKNKTNLSNFKEKGPDQPAEQLNQLEQKCDFSQAVFEKDNEELKKSLDLIVSKRFIEFEHFFKQLVVSEMRLFSLSNQSMSNFEKWVNASHPNLGGIGSSEKLQILESPLSGRSFPTPPKIPTQIREKIANEFPNAKRLPLNQFADVLLDPKFSMAKVLLLNSQPGEQERIMEHLMTLFLHVGWSNSFASILITAELNSARESGTLFRSRSLCVIAIQFILEKTAKEYLQRVLKQPLFQTLAFDKPGTFEIDPSKIQAPDTLTQNQENLFTIAQWFLDSILKSAGHCPQEIRSVLTHLRNETLKKFPENLYPVLGNFIFLRFFNAAIVNPEAFELCRPTDVPWNVRRGLLLVSKILQNLSNQVQFSGVKEPFMTTTNRFVVDNFETVQAFLDDLSMPPPATSPSPTSPSPASPQTSPQTDSFVTDDKAAESVLYLYSVLFSHQKTLLPLLQSAHLDAHKIGMLLASVGDIVAESQSSPGPTPPTSPELQHK